MWEQRQAQSSTTKGRKHATSPEPWSTRELLGDPRHQTLVPSRESGSADTLTPPLTLHKVNATKKRTGRAARLAWSQDPVRNVRKLGPILTRDAGQIRVRVTGAAGSEKAGQPACGFVAASPAALHSVAANCPFASHRRLRAGWSGLPSLLGSAADTRVTIDSFTR